MVKGYAGAGKSIVLMAIAERYRQVYQNEGKNKVAIFTFQNTLVSTTKELLHENEASDEIIHVSTIDSYIQELYKYLVAEHQAPKRRFPYNNSKQLNDQRLKNVDAALKAHREAFGTKHRFHDFKLQFWLEEFDWMKDMNVWVDDLDYYLSLPRTGRGGEHRMRASERVVAYQIFTEYCKQLEKTGWGDWADKTLYIVRHRDLIPDSMKYDHVLVDEAQDLSLTQMTALLGVYNKDMTVAMDMNQRIHAKYWTPKLLGIETTTKKLTKSMRTTKQIDSLAESIRKHNDSMLAEDDLSLRAIPEREGPKPLLVHLRDQAGEKKFVLELIQSHLKKSDQITIGIISSKNSNLAVVSEWLADAGIPHEKISKDSSFSIKKPGVKLVTAHGAKGLEFNVVIIPMFAQGNYPFVPRTIDDEEALNSFMIQMRNLVYVSMTRAKAQLVITYWGTNGSQFIGEMDSELFSYDDVENGPIERTYARPIQVGNSAWNIGAQKSWGTSKTGTREEEPPSKPPLFVEEPTAVEADLVTCLEKLGVAVSDKRAKGGGLWISGDRAKLDAAMSETKKRFGARWSYSEKRGSYFTKCAK